MSEQPSHACKTSMRSSPNPANPFFHSAEQRVALARERFFHDGERPRGLVSDGVIGSWERCLGSGLAPQQRPEFEPVSRGRAQRLLQRNRQLLQAARPECDQLESTLAGTRCKALLTDRDGIVLHATASGEAAGSLLETAGRIGVYLGESNFGSTAPSIATHAEEACSVAGGEHFFSLLQPMHCTAAPIRDRQGRVVAALDLSIEGRPFGFDALTLVRLTASAIEQRLFIAQSRGQVVLRLQLSPGLLDSPLAALLAFDEDAQVAALNGGAMQLLQARPVAAPGDAEALLGLSRPQLLALARQQQPATLRLPCGLRVFVRADSAASAAADGTDDAPAVDPAPAAGSPAQPPALPAGPLRDAHDELIAATLQRLDGNVSRAARALGVSRGLVYRHLQRRRGT